MSFTTSDLVVETVEKAGVVNQVGLVLRFLSSPMRCAAMGTWRELIDLAKTNVTRRLFS